MIKIANTGIYIPFSHTEIVRLRYALYYERERNTKAGQMEGANECLAIDRKLTKYVLAATKMNFPDKLG